MVRFEAIMPNETQNKPKHRCIGLRIGEDICIGISYTEDEPLVQDLESIAPPVYAPIEDDKKSPEAARLEAKTFRN